MTEMLTIAILAILHTLCFARKASISFDDTAHKLRMAQLEYYHSQEAAQRRQDVSDSAYRNTYIVPAAERMYKYWLLDEERRKKHPEFSFHINTCWYNGVGGTLQVNFGVKSKWNDQTIEQECMDIFNKMKG